MDEYALVRTQVPKVEEHQVGSDVIDRKCRCLLKAHALRHQEGVCGRHHYYFLPHTAPVQNQDLITHLQTRKQKRSRNIWTTALECFNNVPFSVSCHSHYSGAATMLNIRQTLRMHSRICDNDQRICMVICSLAVLRSVGSFYFIFLQFFLARQSPSCTDLGDLLCMLCCHYPSRKLAYRNKIFEPVLLASWTVLLIFILEQINVLHLESFDNISCNWKSFNYLGDKHTQIQENSMSRLPLLPLEWRDTRNANTFVAHKSEPPLVSLCSWNWATVVCCIVEPTQDIALSNWKFTVSCMLLWANHPCLFLFSFLFFFF